MGTVGVSRGNSYAPEAARLLLYEATYLKSVLPHHILKVSHLHFPSFEDQLRPCQSFGSCLEVCLSTQHPQGEADRETDRLTEVVSALDVSAEKHP